MANLTAMIWIEARKALRSRVPLLTALLFLLMPLADAFMMFIFKDPEFARQAGLISAKANLMGGSADWTTYLSVLSQAIAIAGVFLFSLILSWLFGREFADGTLKDMLAVPMPRASILLAKFMVGALWCLILTLYIFVVALLLGSFLGLAGASAAMIVTGSLTLAVTAFLVVLAAFPIALFASIGRGYLLPLGIVFAILVLSQLIAAIGYGSYFPWSIPAMYVGFTDDSALVPVSYWIIALTGLAGIAGTHLWWRFADQGR